MLIVRKLLVLFIFFTFGFYLVAQEDTGEEAQSEAIEEDEEYNFDEIFAEDLLIEDPELITEESMAEDLESELVQDGFILGGELSSKFTGYLTWDSYLAGEEKTPDDIYATGFAGVNLFFDSWREENFRVFGKLEAIYPYNQPSWGPGVNFRIIELFSDFGWRDTLYFRWGMQNLKWGLGRIFNVADVFASDNGRYSEPEGKLALKATYPFGNNNIYSYTVIDEINYEAKSIDMSQALKFEFVLGSFEYSLGAFYSAVKVPKGIVAFSGSIGSFSLTGETMFSYGSDRQFVNADQSTYTIDDEVFFNADLAFYYRYSEKSLGLDLAFYWQLLYLGEGYESREFLPAVHALRQIPEDNPDAGPVLSNLDASPFYKYYSTLNIEWIRIMNSFWDMEINWQTNFIDYSGFVNFKLTYPFFNHFLLNTGFSVNYGDDDSEVILTRSNRLSLNLGLSIGGGKF